MFKYNLPTKCSNGTPIRFNCLVSNGVACKASSMTNQNIFGTCFSVYPKRVISANCSGRRNVGVITYNGGKWSGCNNIYRANKIKRITYKNWGLKPYRTYYILFPRDYFSFPWTSTKLVALVILLRKPSNVLCIISCMKRKKIHVDVLKLFSTTIASRRRRGEHVP